MRLPRASFLPQAGALVHKIWRAHNRQFVLKSHEDKALYLKALRRGVDHRSVKSEVKIHSYCVMSNHGHVLVLYHSVSNYLSNFMRVAHSIFGQSFNRRHKRQGPVAYDRPKTPWVQPSLSRQMEVHFYIEANPLRAGMVRNLKLYEYSSFSHYAWGVVNEFTGMLTAPEWYKNLGATPEARQSKYRSLFDRYLREFAERLPAFTHTRFIGDADWKASEEARFREQLRVDRARPEPPPNEET
jgi:REP element-mobilizing transposase RayT